MILVFIFIACTCIYSVSTETVGFIQQPMTDKECHEEGDNGRLTLSFNVMGTTRLDNYIVALTVNPEGTGGFKSNGTELMFYVNKDQDLKHDRYRVTMSYIGRTVEYRLEINALEFLDETSPLYAFIIESHSGKFMTNVSSGRATFHVDIACPQRPQPTSSSVTNKVKGDSNQDHTSDPKEPSTATAPPNNDSTSTGYIPAKRIIGIPDHILIYILIAICLCILAISSKILHLLHNSPRLRIPGEPLEMSKRNRNKKHYFK